MDDKIKLKKEDIDQGLIELPDGYVITKVKTKAEKLKEVDDKIAFLQGQIGPAPQDQELIDLGKEDHPHYKAQAEIEILTELKKQYE